jgi:murein DD-endopeptidase MepM/ murein hydrolase activator NlpD
MKNRSKKEIMLVPPDGSKIRTVGVRSSLILVIVITIACGFAGYLIPFNNFSIDVVEQNQRKNLESQNKKLLLKIHPMKRLLDNLNNEIERIENKRRVIAGRLGLNNRAGEPFRPRTRAPYSNLDDLVEKVRKNDEYFCRIVTMVTDHPGYFDSIPLIMPIISNLIVTARFDREADPFTNSMKNHYGIDFAGTAGTPVIATASGTVVKIEDGKIWGKRIVISHGFGFSSVYAHLGSVEVSIGKKVRKGDCIAALGLSGVTSGPHLHYEVWRQGAPVNPEDFFFPDVNSVPAVALR